MGLFATLSINDDQHNNTAIMLSDVLNQLAKFGYRCPDFSQLNSLN